MTVREVAAPARSTTLLTRALLGAFARRTEGTLPELELVRRHVTVDHAHLAAYNQACGFRRADMLSPTYPFVLAFPLQMEILTDAAFPFPIIGVVHLQNRIRQHRPIGLAEPLTLSVRAANLRPHDKGLQFDTLVTLSVADEVVWESVSSTLRRQGSGSPAKAARGADAPAARGADAPAAHAAEQWTVPADTGRRYASASGDHNPIHLYPITARLFGFPRAIAHGMWTKARCLAALEHSLPDAFSVDVQFKSPVLLPAQVDFSVERQAGGGTAFGLADSRSGKPHLTGSLMPQLRRNRAWPAS
ncbi:MaoC family dehydratase [Aquabacterium humicola]|uniref:MaoC family dehydratase n=1 Tax=Aquabacterium humicola TaxID=3237377 RepID=UPI0025434C02|nr:MaoC/PaaZ C-terminal domain-containing protein [Rubrivivax pictus]